MILNYDYMKSESASFMGSAAYVLKLYIFYSKNEKKQKKIDNHAAI